MTITIPPLYVYVMSGDSNLHKIGISRKPQERLWSVRDQSKIKNAKLVYQVRLALAREVEKVAQQRLIVHQVVQGQSREWFAVSAAVALAAVKWAIKHVGDTPVPEHDWEINVCTSVRRSITAAARKDRISVAQWIEREWGQRRGADRGGA